MPLTPEDVSNKRFTPVRLREGYDMGEVDQFLDEVEAELARLTRDNNDLRSKLTSAPQGDSAAATAATAPATPPGQAPAGDKTVEEATAPAAPTETIKVHTAAEASNAAARLLEIAARNADELVGEARNEAEQIVGEARTTAEGLESDARSRSEMLDSETAERRTQLLGDLDKEKAKLNGEVESLRSFEREYRSRLKTYFQQQLEALDGDAASDSPDSGAHPPRRLQSLLGEQDESQADQRS